MAEQVEVSALPKPRSHPGDDLYRAGAAVLFRALRRAGDEGLAWRECYSLLADHEDTTGGAVGKHVTYMRSRGVGVVAFYEGGETRFRLEP